MGVIAKYKFDSSVYANYLPIFNTEFTGYTVEDIDNGDNTITRTISHDTLKPTLMRFGDIKNPTDRENSLLEVIECDTSNITDMYGMFYSCASLTSINLSNFNTDNVTKMNNMFFNCRSLTSLDLSSFNTSNVDTINSMFCNCSSLTSLDLSNFNTGKVTNIYEMFRGCSSLTSLDLSSFDTSKVTSMNNMFGNCSALTILDLSNFNTSKVTDMSDMFNGCSSLTSLDLSNFNSDKVTNMAYMFAGCSSLTSLDLSSFNTNQVTNMSYMFSQCSVSTIGLLYASPSTINNLLTQLGTFIARDIYYVDANPSQLTSQNNINYIKYKENKVTANVTLRKVGDVQDELDLETGVLTQRIGEDGVVLSQQIVKTVDLTIKDQDDKIIQSLHTHPSTTYINLSSDGLIPSAELSYTMYGNIGETTGEKITDGTDSKLIEGKVYGDTLLNVLPSPSLKNSMDYNISMQKLNNGYDNVNVADGEFKQATLYGQTLVNHCPDSIYIADGWRANEGYKLFDNFPTLVKGKTYTFYAPIGSKEGNPGDSIVNLKITTDGTTETIYQTYSNSHDTIFKTFTMGDRLWFNNYPITGKRFQQNYPTVMILEGEWTQESIPEYFEGMQSVVMPSVKTSAFIPMYSFLKDNGQDNFTKLYTEFYEVTNDTFTFKQSRHYQQMSITTDCFEKHGKQILELNKPYQFKIEILKNTLSIDMEIRCNGKFTDGKTRNVIAGETPTYEFSKTITTEIPENDVNGSGEMLIFHLKTGYTGEISFRVTIGYGDINNPKSNTLTTPEDITLRAVGDVRDELDCLTGEVTERIGEIVLNGSEDWTNPTNKDSLKTFRLNKSFSTSCTQHMIPNDIICDKLKLTTPFKVWANNGYIPESPMEISRGVSKNDGIDIIVDVDRMIQITDLSSFKLWLSENLINVQYIPETESIKTVDLSITDQDNQPQTALHTIANGYINTSSQGLLPKVDYEVPTSNSYYLDMVKLNTQYTTKSSSDCNATIDGTSYPLSANGTFTTPSTITDNLMVLDAQVDDLMFIEGDLTGRELDYFTGLQSVDMPVLTICKKNLFDFNSFKKEENRVLGSKNYSSFKIKLKPNTKYSFNRFTNDGYNSSCYLVINIVQGASTGALSWLVHSNSSGLNNQHGTFTTNSTGIVYISGILTDDNLNKTFELIQNLIIVEGDTIPTIYELYQGNTLTTTSQIALHRIGDVKDELDLVNECVVRRIGRVVLDGSENWTRVNNSDGTGRYYYKFNEMRANSDIISPSLPTVSISNDGYGSKYCVCSYNRFIFIYTNHDDVNSFKQWLSENNVELYYQSQAPTTEPIRIVPQNRKQSTTSLTLQSPLQKVGDVADQLRWNPYKGHYVRYNYIQDGVANSTYTFEDLKDMNERKFVNLYNQRTYIDTDHTVQVISHGLSRYCLAEQGKQYQVRWDWVEQPSVDTIKVDLCGNVKEIPSNDNSVIIDVEKFTHQFIQIQGLGLSGKITNLMVIETVNGEIPDVDFFSGIQCIGNTVQIDGNTKVQIDMEQTNGNLIDIDSAIFNNGNYISYCWNENNRGISIRNGKTYTFKHLTRQDGQLGDAILRTYNKDLKMIRAISSKNSTAREYCFTAQYNEEYIRAYAQMTTDGSTHIHYPFELCYADMAKDGIRPRYYDKESIILPMKLCRVGNIYDNLYYDDLKGYYRIQQSIGHKYFTGETTEVWTMETTNGYRTIKFTCTSANIDQIALGETICNSFKHLSTINDDIEGFIIYNGNFVLRIDKDRLVDKTVDGFKTLLASSPIHLFYQLKTPQMINLTEYPNRIEFNTYRDEIFTFFKGMNPTKFTLSVPMDKTYRYEIEEEGQGLANRVTVNNETISAENVVAVKEVRGQGIANIIEDVNNVVITPRPNHGGIATSHTLNNTKPATIRIHGFEPSGDTAIGTYNTTDKAYQLKVMSSNGDNSLSDYYVLNVPYKLETYADGTKDMVYYDEAYKQWHFKGLSVKEYTVASDGTLGEVVEVFKGLTPRSGMIAEFKLMFISGTTSSRMYYSLNGTTYSYTSLRNMSDGNYLYVGIFNTGGTKIDIAYKTDPNEEYTNFSPLSTQIPECFMVNQIQSCEFCEVTLDKQYIYSEMNSPIELDTYDGTTKVFMDGNATDTNIIIKNEATTKIVNTYTDTEYTVYWKYVDGLGNLKLTLGGTTVEVDGKQEYATIKTQLNAPQELLYVGGYNLSIKDLMVVKGAKIDDLPYFEGSRQVGTLVLDEEGNKSYKITLVQGGSVLEQRDEDTIAFKDDNKHNVVVHKIVGVCPTKVD